MMKLGQIVTRERPCCSARRHAARSASVLETGGRAGVWGVAQVSGGGGLEAGWGIAVGARTPVPLAVLDRGGCVPVRLGEEVSAEGLRGVRALGHG